MKQTLAIVLTLGNYMNGGTAKGQADGFEIDALTKLITTKNISNKISLVHYIATTLKNVCVWAVLC